MKRRKKVNHSFATYLISEKRDGGTKVQNYQVDLDELAEFLSANWGNVPLRINDKRAMEIHCLAKAYRATKRVKK